MIEARGRHPLLRLRLLADRNRTGANLAMLGTGAALFGMFFFLTLFLPVVWGYSAVKADPAYLPMTERSASLPPPRRPPSCFSP